MNYYKVIAETVDYFRKFYGRADFPEINYYTISQMMMDAIPLFMDEISEINTQLCLLRNLNLETFAEYLAERALDKKPQNSITCVFDYHRGVDGNLFITNETIPDHFSIALGTSSSVENPLDPFLHFHEFKITTPFFDELKQKGHATLQECSRIKRGILHSDRRFNTRYKPLLGTACDNYGLIALYHMGEAERLEAVEEVAKDIKDVYGALIRIAEGLTA